MTNVLQGPNTVKLQDLGKRLEALVVGRNKVAHGVVVVVLVVLLKKSVC